MESPSQNEATASDETVEPSATSDATSSSGSSKRKPKAARALVRNEAEVVPAPLPLMRTQEWPARDLPVPDVQERFYPLPELPRADGGGMSRVPHLMFMLFVVAPVIVTAIYYFGFASPQYAAEFRFAVTDNTPTSSAGSTASSVSNLLGLGSSSGSSQQNWIVTDYLSSRQAVEDLQKRISVVQLYSKPGIDWWARFDKSASTESFVNYWQSMMKTSFDPISGLATAQVRAFSAEDAYSIATNLVKLSEDLVNGISMRTQIDAVRFAEKEVERAEKRMTDIRKKLDVYRTKQGVINPTDSAVASNIQLYASLRLTISQLTTQLQGLTNQHVSPASPQAQSLRAQLSAAKAQLATIEREIGFDREKNAALATLVGEYETLQLDNQYAQAAVVSTRQALDAARASAASQHLYLTPYVRPALPSTAVYPRKVLSTLAVLLVGFGAWVVGLLLYRSIMEHAG